MLRILASAAFAFLCAASPASAVELPARKPGLWQLTMTFVGRNLPVQTIQHCVDANSDKLMNNISGETAGASCSKRDIQASGNTITVDSVCKFGDATTRTHATVTGSFNSAYTITTESTREGGRPLPGTSPGQANRMTVAAKWLGPCKAGQQPGDIIMSNGMKMNVLKLRGTRPQH